VAVRLLSIGRGQYAFGLCAGLVFGTVGGFGYAVSLTTWGQ
jgi:hypothetical protein